jgi:hypothetical protein
VLVDAGHLWRKHQLAVPFGDVEHFGIGVQLSLTKHQVEDLAEL